MSFPLQDKHAVNEHHTIQKNHDSTQKKCPHIVHIFNVLRDWFKTDSQHQKHYSVGVAVYWEE